MESLFITVAVCAGLILLVPLWIWGATSDWRKAWRALSEYLMVMGAFVVVGGGLGLLAALMERL